MALSTRHFWNTAELRTSEVWRSVCSLMLLAGTAGCQEMVILGTECSNGDLPCPADSKGPTLPPDDDALHDAEAEIDATSEPIPDAQVSPTADLVITNPDFERQGGLDGDLMLVDLLQTIPFVSTISNLVLAELPGWYACWPLSVTTNSPGESSAGYFISFVPSTFNLFDFVPVRQDLVKPLRRGDTVHMVVQAIANSQGANNLYLAVHGANDQCKGALGPVLGRSEIINDTNDWQKVCVTFQADQDYSVLTLKPTVEGALPAPAQPQPSLLLDTIELVETCP